MTNPTLMPERVALGEAIIEPQRNRILVARRSHRITSRDMDVLLCLISAETRVLSRQEILDRVWKDVVVNEEALTLSVSRLRRVLGDDPRHPRYIETIPKKGYRLVIAPRVGRRGQLPKRVSVRWVVALAVLCVIFASLYFFVRQEYERIGAENVESSLTLDMRD